MLTRTILAVASFIALAGVANADPVPYDGSRPTSPLPMIGMFVLAAAVAAYVIYRRRRK